MILSIALLAQGIRLHASSYSQHIVDDRQVRRRLAHIAWRDRLDSDSGPTRLNRWLTQGTADAHSTAHSAGHATKSAETTVSAKKATVSKAKRACSRERLRRRRQRENSKLVLGGTRIKRRVTSTDRIPSGNDSAHRSRKRSAASIAVAAGATDTSQRHLPPKKKRKRPPIP